MDFTPSFETPDWANLAVIHRNTLEPRASFYNYRSATDALSFDLATAAAHCLSGTWKFKVYDCPFDIPDAAASDTHVAAKYGDIAVPGMWQLQGYGQGPRYTNMSLPFPVDPPHVPLFENETGHYVREFQVPAAFADQQLRLRFEGVDSAFHVYVNGNEVGYSQGSRNPSEFDITRFVSMTQSNALSVVVYQKSNGTYLEDQDQWWLSGIFRDVYLLAFPKVRMEDFKVETWLDEQYQDADLSINVRVNSAAAVHLELLDAANKRVASASSSSQAAGQVPFKLDIKDPVKWTAETPYLYKVVLTLAESGQVICQRVGFRQVEIKDGVIVVNGKRIVLRGINRHEHNPKSGRAVPYDFMRNDLLQMKKHNINAIRTAHYPNDYRLYDLADELGFWIMDEADLETHGFSYVELAALTDEERKMSKKGVISLECGRATEWITDKPEWEESFVDRQKQIVSRDKNHPSVIIWSLGNESYHGKNTIAAFNWVRQNDTTRPIHYEGDRDAEVVDMYSLMYPEIWEVLDLEATSPQKKPILLCEYLYGIGNGAGAIREYIDLFYKYPRLQGGFAWQWASQGLETRIAEGELFYGYGGDFGDMINDGREMTHGYNFSDHTPKPALAEFKKAWEPVQIVSGSRAGFQLINCYDFSNLDHLKCEWSIIGDGYQSKWTEVPLPNIKPGETSEVLIQGVDLEDASKDYFLDIALGLRADTLWAPAGHEISRHQLRLQQPHLKAQISAGCPDLKQLSPSLVEIRGSTSTWTFDCLRGLLTSWAKQDGTNMLLTPPTLSFYRAMTDHDALGDGLEWDAKLLKYVRPYTKSVKATKNSDNISIEVIARAGPTGLEWGFDTVTTYTFTKEGLDVAVTGRPFGVNAPKTLARIGLEFVLSPDFDKATWFGRGPGEAYRDRKWSQTFGNWEASIDRLFTHFEYPQESGNRADVRWVTFADSKKGQCVKASFGTQEGCSFNASHYSILDVDKCAHPWELKKLRRDEVIVRLDWDHHGLGTGAIGPKTLPEYALRNEPFTFQLALK